MRRWVPAPLLFSLVSVALHLLWARFMPSGESAEQTALPSLVELELAAAPERATAATPEAPQEPAAAAPSAPATPARTASKPAPRSPRVPAPATLEAPSSAEPQPAAVEVASAAPAPQPAAPEQVAVAKPPAKLDLSARAAALTLSPSSSDLPAARCSTDRSSPAADSCKPSDIEAHAQAELSRHMRAAASNVPHLTAREKPKLQPRSDGSYDFDGHVFHARVMRDGQVEFADSGTTAEIRPSLIPFKATGDLADLVEKHILGKELYSAEKLWFLDQTRELREKLATAHRLEEAARARRELEKELQRILSDGALAVTQKHAAVFALWQDCGDDAQAEATRRQVEAFVQRFMPRGGPLGFEPGELDAFNLQRAGMRQFRPYGLSQGGSSG